MKIFKNILLSIVLVPLSLLGAICIAPFLILAMIIELLCCVVQDIWRQEGEDENE